MSFDGKEVRAFAHDYETTGLDVPTLGVVQTALLIVTVQQDGTYEIHDKDVQLLNPGQEIHPNASKIHGYYAIDLINHTPWEPYLREQMETVNEMKLGAVIGYNSGPFDNRIAARVGFKPLPSIDMIKAARKFKTKYKWTSAKLVEAYKQLCGKELVGAHDASADIIGTLDMIAPAIKLAECECLDDFTVWMKGDDGTPEMKIGFGKHKDSKLKFLPASYIDWLLGPKCDMPLSAELIEGLEKCRL